MSRVSALPVITKAYLVSGGSVLETKERLILHCYAIDLEMLPVNKSLNMGRDLCYAPLFLHDYDCRRWPQ